MFTKTPAANGHRAVPLCTCLAFLAGLLFLGPAFAAVPDTDGDGIIDNLDNCVILANSGQQDTDSDGIGNRCDADLNNDGLVNFGDLAAFKSAFIPRPYDANADFNSDGFVNFGDLAIIKSLFLKDPGPAGYAQWVTDGDGDWGDRLNWFPAVLPPAQAYVTIDVPSAITVTVDDNMSFAATQVDSEERLVVDGTLSVSGTLQVNDELVLAGGGRLEDATILPPGTPLETIPSTTFTFDNITLSTDFILRNGSTLNLYTGLTLSGSTFTLASSGNNTSVVAQGSATVGGTGTIAFGGSTTSDLTNRLYQNTASETLVFGPDVAFETVSSGGRIGLNSGSRGVDIQGPVNSAIGGRVVRLEGEPASFRGDLLQASNGGGYFLDGNWDNDDIITLSDSDLEFEGTWSNTGQIHVTNTPLELDGMTTSTGLGVITSDGQVLLTGTVDNTSATLDVDLLPAGLVFTSGGRVNGGTITGSAGLATANGVTVALDGVTLATQFTLNNGSTLNLYSGMTLSSGTFVFASTGNNTSLVAQGTQTIDGTGDLVFAGTTASDVTNRLYQNASGQTLTLGAGVTVQSDTSAGRIGLDSGGRGMAVLGTVVSDISGREVHLEGEPLSFDADNLLASAGGGFYISGDWTLQAGDTLTVDGGEVDLIGGAWTNEGTIVVSNGDLNLAGTWDNNGTITANNSLGELDGELTTADLGSISSDGTVQLTATVDNTSAILDLDDLPAGLILSASGRINGGIVTGSSALRTANGVTVALDDVILQADFVLNNGSTLNLYSGLTLSGTGFILSSTGNNTSVVAQGGLTVGGTGTIRFSGSTGSDFTNRLYQNIAGQTLAFAPGIAFETVSSGGRIGLNSGSRGIDVQGPVTCDLSGRVVRIEGEPANFRGDLLQASNGCGYYFDGNWFNDETITLSDSDLEFEGSWSNSGQIHVLNTPLELDGATTTAGLGVITSDGQVLLTGTVDNTGATLDVDPLPAGLVFTSGGRVNGGTITGSAGLATANGVTVALDGVTLATQFTLNNGSTLNLYSGMELASGTFVFASTGNNTSLVAQGTQTIDGTGDLVFAGTTPSDVTNRLYQNVAGQTLTLGAGVTVQSGTSAGRLGLDSGARGLAVLGTVVSDISGREVHLEGEPLSFDADELLASNGGGFYISGDWTLQAGDTLTVDGGEVDLIGGAWTNEGTIVMSNGDLNLDGTWVNSGSIDLSNTPLEIDGNVTTAGLGTILSDSTVTLTATLDNNGSALDTDALPAGFGFGNTAYIDGGSITGSAALSVDNSVAVDLDGVTLGTDLTIGNGAQVELTGGLTLSSGRIFLASIGANTYLRATEGLTIGGTGEIVFAASSLSDSVSRIDIIPNTGQVLVIGPDVIVRTDTSGAQIGASGSRGITLQGQLISNVPGRNVRLQANPLSLEGSISIGDDSTVEVFASDLDMTATAALDIDISAVDTGFLNAGLAVDFDGDLNLVLIGGFVPAECDEFVIGGYASRTGSFDAVNGPDFGGETFEVFYDATQLRIRRPGAACP